MKITPKQLKKMIREEFKKVTESSPADVAEFTPDKGEDPNAPDEKPFVLHFLNLLVNGDTGQPYTPEEIAAMDSRAIGDLASQMRQALRGSGAKRIPPLSDPGAFDPFEG